MAVPPSLFWTIRHPHFCVPLSDLQDPPQTSPPVSKTVKVMNEDTDLVLQDQFSSISWDVFNTSALREECSMD